MLRILTLLLILSSVAHAQNWREIRGGHRGEAHTVAVTSTGTIVHGTFSAGILRSTDGGEVWEPARAANGESIAAVMSLPVTSIVVGERPGEILVTSSKNIYRSTDDGATWSTHHTGISDGDRVLTIASIARVGSDATLIGTASGFWRSNDGLSGHSLIWGADYVSMRSDFVRAGGFIFAGTDSGVYRFDASGTLVAARLRSGMHAGASVRSLYASGSTLFAGTDSGLYRSTDLGSSWGRRQLADASVRAILPLDDGVILLGTERGIVRSADDGTTWASVHPALDGRPVSALARRHDGLLVAGTAFGVYVSRDDGASWQSTVNGLESGQLNQVLGLDSALVLVRIGGARSPIWRSTNAGLSWSPAAGLDSAGVVQQIARGPNGMVAAAAARGVFVSRDDGATWSLSARDSSTSAVAVGPNRRIIASNPQARSLHVSVDNGATWTMADVRGDFWSLAIDGRGTFFAADGFGLRRSTDDGVTWSRPRTEGTWIGTIAVDRSDIVWVGTELGLSRSTDGGATFVHLAEALPGPQVNVIAPSPDGHLMIASSYEARTTGLRRTTDVGVTWGNLPHDFPVVGARSISYDDGGYLYVLVHLGSGDYATRTVRPMTPAIREPIEPPDGASGLPPYVTLRWPEVPGAGAYHVQLSEDPLVTRARPRGSAELQAAARRVDDSTLTAATREVTDLTPGVTWHWRVRAKIDGEWDLWSPVFRFTTAGGPGGADDREAWPAGDFRLVVVDADTPSLQLNAAHRSHVSLSLHALNGSRIATLVDGVLERGQHAIALPALASGTYVAILRAGKHSVGEIVIVRY